MEHWLSICSQRRIPRACTDRLHGCGSNKNGSLTGVARLSLPAILALAEEIRHQVSTRPTVVAGAGAAVIDVWQRHLKCDLLRIRIRSPLGGGGSCDLLISQWSPSQPSAQMHWYTLILSMQVPPLWHGLLSQSLMSGTEDGE